MAQNDKRPPFAGGRRLERVRCVDCNATGALDGLVDDGAGVGFCECPACRGRKFVWVSVVEEG